MSPLAVVKRMHEAASRAREPEWLDEHGERIMPHGFRSSFRMWCGDHGHPRELAEEALAHAVGSAVERAYARSDLFERRRVLMEQGAAFVTG